MSLAPTILTAAGYYFDFDAPERSHIGITEIAHALGHLCRFTGHTQEFYSVAQHSVLVSNIVPPELALEGLLHDAHEAFVGDMSAPLKDLLPDYQRVELRIEAAVRRRFGLPADKDPRVKRADLIALRTEQRDLMLADRHLWTPTTGLQPLDEPIVPLSPMQARMAFMRRFMEVL